MFFRRKQKQAYRTIPLSDVGDTPICKWCAGLHVVRPCPRILRISYYDDPANPERVAAVELDEVLNHQLWEDVVWPEGAPLGE